MNPLYEKLIRYAVWGTLVILILAVLLVSAGTLNYWQGWAYVAVFVTGGAAYRAYLTRHDPALLRRRTEAGTSHEQEPAQKIIVRLLIAATLVLVVVPPLDVRFGWSLVPWYVSIIGNALVASSFYVLYLVSKVNTYAAANVRVEEGQTVISTGLYGVVRHPMYFGALFLFVGTPLALGSWWTLLLIPFLIPILVARLLNEEKVLARDLPGYTEYQKKVTSRLIPFIW